jgi:hypothetical protein
MIDGTDVVVDGPRHRRVGSQRSLMRRGDPFRVIGDHQRAMRTL